MQKKRLWQGVSGNRFLVFALFMLVFSGGLRAAVEEEYQKKKISLQAVDETVEEILNKIGKAADVRFFYNHSAFDFQKKMTIDVRTGNCERSLRRYWRAIRWRWSIS